MITACVQEGELVVALAVRGDLVVLVGVVVMREDFGAGDCGPARVVRNADNRSATDLAVAERAVNV